MSEPLEEQIDRLTKFIMVMIPGEPSQGAVDTAMRIICDLVRQNKDLQNSLDEAEKVLQDAVELDGRVKAYLKAKKERA